MPGTSVPRSVSDATRFTATTPHASSKAATHSRFTPPANSPAGGPRGGAPAPIAGETPAQRVQRLRAAHLRAKTAQASRFDRVIELGRSLFDSAHRITVISLVGLTAVTGIITVYTAMDMLAFNRKRRNEFLEAQRSMEADSLEAARLAYMTNKASPEQIAMVEEAIARDAADGKVFQMPAVLGAPKPAHADAASTVEIVPSMASTGASETAPPAEQAKGGLSGWLFGSLKKEDEAIGDDKTRSVAQKADEKQAYIRAKAKQAFEMEKENQRHGGPLDQVGISEQPSTEQKKKGWW